MLQPHDPQQAGSSGVQHDDRPDASHEEEVRKAERNDQSVNREDKHEGSPEQSGEEKADAKEEEKDEE